PVQDAADRPPVPQHRDRAELAEPHADGHAPDHHPGGRGRTAGHPLRRAVNALGNPEESSVPPVARPPESFRRPLSMRLGSYAAVKKRAREERGPVAMGTSSSGRGGPCPGRLPSAGRLALGPNGTVLLAVESRIDHPSGMD